MIVASVVTIPDRCEDLLHVLENLLYSTVLPDKLYISVPLRCTRLGKEYSTDDLFRLKNFIELFHIPTTIVEYEEDLGPCLKLLTPIRNGLSEGDSVVIFDDDSGLFPNAIQCMTTCMEKHGTQASYGIMGTREGRYFHGEFITREDYCEVDIIGGFRGALYPYETLKNFEGWMNSILESYKERGMIPLNDDQIFSYFLKSQGFPRRIVNVTPKDSPDGETNYWVKSPDGEVFTGFINYAPRYNTNGIVDDPASSTCLSFFNELVNN